MSNNTKQIYVISVFPEIVENFIKYGVLKRSQDKDLLKINMINLRDFSKNKGQIEIIYANADERETVIDKLKTFKGN